MIKIELKIGGTELAKVLHFYGRLEAANEYKIVCPFHDDINPSMIVNLNEGKFYCFGCNASGDAFKFVQLINKKLNDLRSAIKFHRILNSDAVKGIKIKKFAVVEKNNKQSMNEAHDYYFGLKKINWAKEKCAEKNYMLARGFYSDSLTKCKAKLTYNPGYPIVFPMFDMGEFKGWVCRTTTKSIEVKRKYLYNEGFSRRSTLVGRYDNEVVYLVEGYMDWLKMKQYGIKHVAAVLGWKITQLQIDKLKKQGVKYVISALDSDTCGKKGTLYLKDFFNVIPFQYPDGVKDPGEMDESTFNKFNEKTQKLFRRTIK